MIYNLINALYYSFIFYIAYSVLYRVIEIKKYVKKSNQDGTMGIFNFADNYTNTIFSMAISIVIWLCLSYIFKKYYPKPEENL